jgi:hypothetical protein
LADAKLIQAGFPFPQAQTAPTISNFTLNASNDSIEYIFQVPPDAASYTITRLGIRQGTVTGTAPTYRYSIQGVSTTTGRADGTIKGGGTVLVDFQPVAGGDGTFNWHTLGASYAASPGEFLSAVITRQSGTIDGSNNCSFGSTFGVSQTFPWTWTIDGGSANRGQEIALFGWGTAGTAYGYPISAAGNVTLASNTTPDEYGMRFIIPAGWCDTYKVMGFRAILGSWNGSDTITFTLYDGTTPLQAITIDTDQMLRARTAVFFFDEATLSTLTAGSTYRLAMAPQTTTGQFLHYIDVAANADLAAYPLGIECYASHRTDAGSWTDVTTRRVFLEPVFADITEPSGGAGIAALVGGSLIR